MKIIKRQYLITDQTLWGYKWIKGSEKEEMAFDLCKAMGVADE